MPSAIGIVPFGFESFASSALSAHRALPCSIPLYFERERIERSINSRITKLTGQRASQSDRIRARLPGSSRLKESVPQENSVLKDMSSVASDGSSPRAAQ